MLNFDNGSLEYLYECTVPVTLGDLGRPDRPLIYVNKCFEDMTGYGKGELIGNNCSLLQCAETDPIETSKLRESINKIKPITVCIRNKRKDGERFWNLLSLHPIGLDGVTVMMGCQHDLGKNPEIGRVLGHAKHLGDVLDQASTLQSKSWTAIRASMEMRAMSVFQLAQSKLKLNR